MARTFYQACAQASFALLGLWWVVVNRKYEEWRFDPRRRRQAYDVSLYFALPGIMSLVSLLAESSTVLWRSGFIAAAAIGVLETALLLRGERRAPSLSRVMQGALAAVLVLYLLVCAVAVRPALAADLGVGLSPLELEGLMVALLVFLGVNLAWVLFMEPDDADAAPRG